MGPGLRSGILRSDVARPLVAKLDDAVHISIFKLKAALAMSRHSILEHDPAHPELIEGELRPC